MIHLNIGSNLNSKFGSRFDNIEIAINLLIDSKIRVIKVSNFYETPSYPNKSFPKFLNVGLMVNFKKNISKLMEIIDLVERKLGKVKFKKNDPRIIDIDIVDFDGIVIDSDNITLPHPRSHIRNFVLYPILEIDPKWSHPIFKKNAQFLINNLSQKSRIEITRLHKNVKIKHD